MTSGYNNFSSHFKIEIIQKYVFKSTSKIEEEYSEVYIWRSKVDGPDLLCMNNIIED